MALDDQLPLNRPAPASTMPVDPASVFAAMQGRGAAPATTPQFDPEQEAAQTMSMGRGIASREDLARQARDTQLSQLTSKESKLEAEPPAPPWAPKMTPMTGGGIGGNLMSILHNIGQGMMAVGAATKIGSNVREMAYQGRDIPYEQQRQALATQISQLQEQGKTGAEVETAGLSTPSRMMAGYGQEQRGAGAEKSGEAALQRVQVDAQRVAVEQAKNLATIAQGWEKLSQGDRRLAFDKWKQGAENALRDKYINTQLDETDIKAAVQRDMVSAVKQDEYLSKSPVTSQILDWMGLGPQFVAPTGAGTPSVDVPPNPKSTTPARPKNVPADAKWDSSTRRWRRK